MTDFKVTAGRRMRKGCLFGFAKIGMPSGMIVSDVTILTGERGPWASPPSKPTILTDGTVAKDDPGKIRYVPIIEFVSRDVRQKFSDAVIAAVRATHSEALV